MGTEGRPPASTGVHRSEFTTDPSVTRCNNLLGRSADEVPPQEKFLAKRHPADDEGPAGPALAP